jgi:pimeloyl-ACP methyl ester carboxylesterase
MPIDGSASTISAPHRQPVPCSSRVRWGDLAGREYGRGRTGGRTFVFLHGLTFDRLMWDPVMAALPEEHHAIAFDLPGHGGSPMLERPGLEAVAEALNEAVLDAGADAPILVGHSIGGPLATIYAARYPSAGVVSVDAPIRLEPIAALLRSLRSQLKGEAFAEAWAGFQESWHLELVPAEWRELLRAGRHAPQELVLSYQSDLLDRPLEDVVGLRDEVLDRLRDAGTPYLLLHAKAPDPADLAWLAQRVPQARNVVWPVRHHFPQLADPARFAALLVGFEAGRGGGSSAAPNRAPSPTSANG